MSADVPILRAYLTAAPAPARGGKVRGLLFGSPHLVHLGGAGMAPSRPRTVSARHSADNRTRLIRAHFAAQYGRAGAPKERT